MLSFSRLTTISEHCKTSRPSVERICRKPCFLSDRSKGHQGCRPPVQKACGERLKHGLQSGICQRTTRSLNIQTPGPKSAEHEISVCLCDIVAVVVHPGFVLSHVLVVHQINTVERNSGRVSVRMLLSRFPFSFPASLSSLELSETQVYALGI